MPLRLHNRILAPLAHELDSVELEDGMAQVLEHGRSVLVDRRVQVLEHDMWELVGGKAQALDDKYGMGGIQQDECRMCSHLVEFQNWRNRRPG